MRTIIVGDVHGCDRQLREILDKTGPGKDDVVVLLGDLFDRGPDSWEVFQTVKTLAETFGQRFVLLRGNHEEYLTQGKMSLVQRLMWDRVGRGATVKSFKAHGERMEDAAEWIRKNGRLFYRGDGVQCVHAGILVEPIEMNDVQTLVHDHEVVTRNRYAGALTVTGHIAIAEPTWFVGDGKTAERLEYGKWRPLMEKGVICVDTGCGKGGRLSAMTVEAGRFRLDRAM